MKSITVGRMFASAAVAFWTASGWSATITVDKVQQRYPWNGLVDIDYTLAYESGETLSPAYDRIEFTAKDNATGKVHKMRTFTQFYQGIPLSEAAGTHRITWQANTDGVTNKLDDVTVAGAINTYGATYMEVDVSGGPNATSYPVTYRNGEPTSGYANDDKYKTDVIVLRFIPAGTCMMGTPASDPSFINDQSRCVQHRVILSKPFWAGIFELTWQQYTNVVGSVNNACCDGSAKPIRNVEWTTIRNGKNGAAPATDSFFGKLRSKCCAKDANGDYTVAVNTFDLPTQAQWEYACRAGTTTPYNDGKEIKTEADALASLRNLAVWDGNYTDDVNGTHDVGTKAPNAWGLYDMHGNVYELCVDLYNKSVHDQKLYLDPVITNGDYPERRGGNWDTTQYKSLTSAMRGSNSYGAVKYNGYRIICGAE